MDRQVIEQYAAGPATLAQAIAGLTDAQLKAVPIPGTWSVQQVVMHLADADLVLSDRMKRVIAEERPPLQAFDESLFAARLCYNEQSVADAVVLFDLNRRQLARVLRQLPDEALERTGIHSERGPLKLEDLIRFAVAHLEHHLRFILAKREKLKEGNP